MRRSSTVLHKIHFKTGNRARGLLSDVSDIHERSHDEPTTSRRGSVWHANPRRRGCGVLIYMIEKLRPA